jgi:predicted exporter
MRGTVRANRRASRTSLILAGIVVAFLLAFFSLAQDVRVSATTYDIDRLQADRARLIAQEQEIRSDLERLGQEPAIRKLSIDAGLTQLGEPLVLPGR